MGRIWEDLRKWNCNKNKLYEKSICNKKENSFQNYDIDVMYGSLF